MTFACAVCTTSKYHRTEPIVMASTADSTNNNTDTDEIDQFQTTIKCVRSGDAWKATEPAGETDCWGRGATPRDAVVNYIEVLEA